MVIAVRAHDKNPWVLERLTALAGYYDPAPQILIVDFGSQEPFRTSLAELCEQSGFRYHFVDDAGVFCLAKARNQGAARSETELLFFSDIDCFGERDLFARLANAANALDLGATFDQVLDLPVYHLGPEVSAAFFTLDSQPARSLHLARAFCRSVPSSAGECAEYVDPHSNFFLIRRDFFDYIGGVNESFRGHGSEDFEFFLRLAVHSRQYPLPDEPSSDVFRPKGKAFFGPRPYRGFRRLLELIAVPAELMGLRIAHLYHERGADNTGWYEQNDWRRDRFLQQVTPFLERRAALLEYDWMPRGKRALVLIANDDHVDMFLPLRLAGYALVPVRAADPSSLEHGQRLIDEQAVDVVAIFNPYMKSHLALRPLFERARKNDVRTLVIERGALPDSWYYGPDMSYADPDFTELDLHAHAFSSEELALADEYMQRLRTGVATLEVNGSFEETHARRSVHREGYAKVCLIPLQIDDDVAVTHFNDAHQPYPEFLSDVLAQASQHPDVLFLIKPHPLSKRALDLRAPNVVACDEQDHIHALIELSDAIICYNSGVGLLALLHEKKVATVGNAFYNVEGLGARADTFAQALAAVFESPSDSFHRVPVRLLVAWLLGRKYSFFRGESVIRDFGVRRSHGYRNLLWYHLNLDGTRSALRSALSAPVKAQSYATSRLGIGGELARREGLTAPAPQRPSNGRSQARRRAAVNKLRKLVLDPKGFFSDSQYAALRWVGERIPDDQGVR